MKNVIYLINLSMEGQKFIFDFKLTPEPRLAAVVLKNNQVVWQKCRGLADMD